MRYLLDTNTCIYLLKSNNPSLVKKFEKLEGQLATSAVVLHELHYGAAGYDDPEKRLFLIDQLALRLSILPFDRTAAELAGQIRYRLRKKGQLIGPYDLFIAATAIANKLTLVTGNIREFSRIESLKTENWQIT